nr:phosphodiester glycosidase family protein [Desulforamulus aquiferis]
MGSKEVLSSMAERTGAVAAINGGFFDTGSGIPVGNVIIDGKAEYISDILRTSFGLTNDGSMVVGYLSPQVKLAINGSELKLNGINMDPLSNGLVLYSPAWNKDIPASMKLMLYPAEEGSFRMERPTVEFLHRPVATS